MSKRDRQGVRTPAGLEQKYNFEKRFDNTMEAVEEVSDSVKKLDESMNQAEIFNRLTNNGRSQGVFMGDDGNIYINASYLVTGILQSKDSKTFYLDLVNGILKGQFSEFSISGKTVDDIADTAAQSAVDSQTQTDIFNKLTDNGTAQGIFYQNGQLYINASYLTAGVLKSNDAATFYLDLANNILKGNFTELNVGGNPIGKMYKGAWTATETKGISEYYTEAITLPPGTYIVSVVCPYCPDLAARVCIGFSAKMAIGTGNTFIDAAYGATTMLASFTDTTSLRVISAASNNSATWSYLDRGGIAAVRVG